MDEKEIQKKYMEYQVIGERIKQLQEQMQTAEQQLIEIMATLQSLDEFSTLKENDEILVPVNNGIFVKANLKKENKLLVNVGSSVVVDKSIDDTKKLIEKQKDEMEGIRGKIALNLNKLIENAQSLEKELNEIIKE